MSAPSWKLPRRTLLRGLGVTIGLPLLDAMVPGPGWGQDAPADPKFRAPRKPIRMLLMNLPNGTYYKEWEPASAGPLGTLPPMLAPFQEHVKEIQVLTNLYNKAADADPLPHYANEGCFLTCTPVKKTEGADVGVGGPSMDQIAARCTRAVTRIPSFHLNLQPPVGGKDSGYARMYNNQLSWSSPTTPVPNEIDPRRAFERLFGSAGKKDAKGVDVSVALSEEDKKSVLDYVASDVRSLQLRLGLSDKRKLDEYLTAVRDVERQVQAEIRELAKASKADPKAMSAARSFASTAASAGAAVKAGEWRMNAGADHARRARIMLDLVWLGFWTDTTRVATFMFGNDRNDINYSFLEGVKETHHAVSHYGEGAEKLVQYRKICLWHAEQVAYLLGRMKSIKEPSGGTLLDNSVVFFGSALNDGNSHGKDRLPILLAGRAGGILKPGVHRVLKSRTPLSNLYLAMMRSLGVMADSFADSTGPLTEIAQG